MKLSLFDLHCDTAGEMLYHKEPLSKNHFAVSLENAKKFDNYIQVMAHFTPHELSDEDGWSNMLAMHENLCHDVAVMRKDAIVRHTFAHEANAATLLLSIEDARILCEKEERVDELFDLGFRILTPLWSGMTCIGGSHNTEVGLTDFGKKAITRAVGLGIIPDISHASEASSRDIFEIAEAASRPVIASHSNAYEICPVSRNLRPWQIERLLHCDGLIGLNLFQAFLRTGDGGATASDVFPHIDYFLEHGAIDALSLGCDMDGCLLPPDIPDLSALPHLAELMLRHGYAEELIHKIFYANAFRFATTYLSSSN